MEAVPVRGAAGDRLSCAWDVNSLRGAHRPSITLRRDLFADRKADHRRSAESVVELVLVLELVVVLF